MEREILFRGKHDPKYGEGWCYGVPYTDHEGDCIIATHNSKMVVIEKTVGQYTGLTDKNGVKIFEGDFIRNQDGDIGRVTWYPEHIAFMIYCVNKNKVFDMTGLDTSAVEVVGNIHDNPELLKGEPNV